MIEKPGLCHCVALDELFYMLISARPKAIACLCLSYLTRPCWPQQKSLLEFLNQFYSVNHLLCLS